MLAKNEFDSRRLTEQKKNVHKLKNPFNIISSEFDIELTFTVLAAHNPNQTSYQDKKKKRKKCIFDALPLFLSNLFDS